MSEPFVGEIRMFAGNFAPAGWAFCNGQLLPVSENETLFSLIGTTYGGDGQSTFALPDLRGRLPIHQGTGSGLPTSNMGQLGGLEQVTLVTSQIPAHTHALMGSANTAGSTIPTGRLVARPAKNLYRSGTPGVPFAADAIASTGQNAPHSNVQPFLCVSFIISLFGIYPSRN